MKTLLALSGIASLSLFATGCGDTHAETHVHVRADEPPLAATYKEGHGLKLTAVAARFLDLETEEVGSRALSGLGPLTTAIPSGALLRTVKGDFVYVANGDWFLRTPVVVGASDGVHLAISEGLYEGDRVVTRGGRGLWLAEIQAVNGGVGCADGH